MTGTIAQVGDPQGAASPETGNGDLRTMLRVRSAPDHARLDGMLGALALHERGGYGRFLTSHAIGLASVQPAAAAFVAARLGVELPDALAMIAADLADIGLEMPARLSAPVPVSQSAGAAYVLLGSRLGMGVIARGVTLPEGATGRYMFDRSLGALWKPMRDWLHAAPAEGAAAEAALAGTRAAFAAFTAATTHAIAVERS